MNALTNDHSVSQVPTFAKRVRKRLVISIVAYLSYLLLLGPLGALAGNGYLNAVPEGIVELIGLPAMPAFVTPGVRVLFTEYLDWWYPDPYRCGCCEPNF